MKSKILLNHILQLNDLCDVRIRFNLMFRNNWNPGQLYSSHEFLSDYEVVRKKYINETSNFFKKLNSIKTIKLYPSKANFILIELLKNKNSDMIVGDLLVNYGVYVRTCSDKIGLEGDFIRLASRTFEQNKIILNALSSTL